MKKIYLPMAIATALAFYSCNNSGSSSTMVSGSKDSSATSMDEQNLEKTKSIYKAIETGDSATIKSLIADDAVDHQGPNGTDTKGGAAITHWLTDMHNHVKDLKFDVISGAAKDDYIFTLVDMKGTASDNSMGAPAGSNMGGKSVDVVKVKDGKMVEHWGFLDWQDVMKMQQPMNNANKKK